MNKGKVFDYISQLEKEMLLILQGHPYKDLVVAEILNSATVDIREISTSNFSDGMTAKNMVSMQIKQFYEPKNISKVVMKYWNDQLTYGFTRVNPTKENLIRFRESVDISKPKVVEQKYALIHCVENFKFVNNSSPMIFSAYPSLRIVAKVLCVLCLFVLAYLFALNGRYHYFSSGVAIDKWTHKIIIPDK